MRAREADSEGYADYDGVKVFYEVFGEGDVTLLFMQGWQLAYSRMWKAQVPYFARHYRVVTYDMPGNGRSDRPTDPAAYGIDAHIGWARAVLDATNTEKAIAIGISMGAYGALMLAISEPQRVEGLVCIGYGLPATGTVPDWMRYWLDEVDGSEGWQKANRKYMRKDYGGFTEFFIGQCFTRRMRSRSSQQRMAWRRAVTSTMQPKSCRRSTRWCSAHRW
jgi:pimeloyl-ACP methyl ester carboxylesterase